MTPALGYGVYDVLTSRSPAPQRDACIVSTKRRGGQNPSPFVPRQATHVCLCDVHVYCTSSTVSF